MYHRCGECFEIFRTLEELRNHIRFEHLLITGSWGYYDTRKSTPLSSGIHH